MSRTKGSKNGVHTYDPTKWIKKKYKDDPEFRKKCLEQSKQWRKDHPLAYRKRLDWGIDSEVKQAKSKRKWYLEEKMTIKETIRELKRDGCVLCGYNKCINALEFHHTEKNKEGIVSKMKSVVSVLREAAKCIVVCANCHREIHSGSLEVPT